MYPFERLVPAWERLWSLVHRLAPWTPSALRWDGDPHDHCRDPRCQVAQGCGWPAATDLRHLVTIVGAFDLAIDGADGHRYRSVLVANRPLALADVVDSQLTAAVNAGDSLSGWFSLLAATVGPGVPWPGRVLWTGAHAESLRALRDGDADVAAIDALTLAYHHRDQPAAVAGLVEIGYGPWVPSPPIVVRRGTPPEWIDELRTAFTTVLDDPGNDTLRDELLLAAFVALDETAYDPILPLGGRR